MQPDTVKQEKPASNARRKVRGIYEKVPGSEVWWILRNQLTLKLAPGILSRS